ncbi:MAG: hypothetical protein COV36_00455 [Alphaproteobacteria bacterium CG11_big_fil_rev_8_21_14_0_20_44_7]|nr:MAG: hypothetical protein COV36_00455 [Alphaproteobacteria bacterium CG11_big_fil_rev_8_21_14_0_20_44_7]
MFFGFTNCPDVCPTSLSVLTAALEELGDDAANTQTIFITVDPERDTPEVMKEYLSNFHPSIKGLTGAPEQIEEVKDKYRVFAARATGEAVENYNMNHSAIIYLMDENDNYVTHFSSHDSSEKIAEIVRANNN